MTSVTFPFFVGKPDPDTKKITLKDAEFRYTTKTARALEQSAGVGIEWLVARGQNVLVLVLMVCYGLQWDPKQKMTEDRACNLIDEFIDAGGSVEELSKACFKALKLAGVYGPPEEDEETGEKKDAEGDDKRPLASVSGSTSSSQ